MVMHREGPLGHGKRHTTEAPFKDILSTTEDSLEPDQLPQKNNSNWKSQSCLKKKKKKKTEVLGALQRQERHEELRSQREGKSTDMSPNYMESQVLL